MGTLWQILGVGGVVTTLLGVILLQVTLIFRGKLIPASTHDILMAGKNEQIVLLTQSRDSWENVAEQRASQLDQALSSLSVVEKFFNEVEVVPRKGDNAKMETAS